MRRHSIAGVIPALVAVTAADSEVVGFTAVDIRHLDSQYPWDMETSVPIHRKVSGTADSLVTTGTRDMVAIMALEDTPHGTTPAIWTTTDLRLCLTVGTFTMSQDITTCIRRGIGIIMAIDFSSGTRLSA